MRSERGFMNKEKMKKRIAVLLLAVLTACIVALSLTACSLFVDALGGNINGGFFSSDNSGKDDTSVDLQENDKEKDKEPSQGEGGFVDLSDPEEDVDPDSGNGSSTGEENGSGEQNGSDDQNGSGDENGGEENDSGDEPGSEENVDPLQGNNVKIVSSLVFDKYSESGYSIVAEHNGATFVRVLGAGLSAANYSATQDDATTSRVTIDSDYVKSLDVGNYDFYYSVRDSKATYYDHFFFEVTNSHPQACDVKIDYDYDNTNAYLTWKCDCSDKKKHTFSFDGEVSEAPAGVKKVLIGNVDRTKQHIAQVKCIGSNTVNTTKNSPATEVISGNYLGKTFSFMGRVSDYYIEDFDELVFAYQYLVFEGKDKEMSVALASAVSSEMHDNDSFNAYLKKVNSKLDIPWNLEIGMSIRGNIGTLVVGNVGGVNSIFSEYRSSVTYDSSAFTSHYSLVASPRSTLPIDNKQAVPVRNSKELLAAVEAGYRPAISDVELKNLYDRARAVCLAYISDEMSDVEKLHVIYDYLAGEINYDYSTLDLYSLTLRLVSMPLANARVEAANYMASSECDFSDDMKAAVEDALGKATSSDELYNYLYVKYLQKLNSFSIEGVFVDKDTEGLPSAAVCEGISYAFMLLARMEGIESYQVSGKAIQSTEEVNHAWNKVVLDGKCYCIDATWGNVKLDNKRFVSHKYFLVDDADFYASHVEYIDSTPGIAILATDNYDYYKQTTIDESNHTLYVSNKAELTEVVTYFKNHGSRYIEMQISPNYHPEDDIGKVLKSIYQSPFSYTHAVMDGYYFVLVSE